ncbi:hypothetical protein JCM21714_2447 [Gracilibacillus boraciitolerans JCM 21714]|uniref:RsgI N-terminal anti-sigma domain-containing protein n=1 Tax=Gracilibacillus boraciitolerans JCM 21714 TaxID=1298598 RepID=W4VKR6_9BACI|nr:hypothetical protein [Gracilibacillus boraciitolerans]GAE93369.1 hypothetical protein JCM21714_2447 [Gracilibacillus boraciitolerans JCM 21714]
MKKGMIVEHKKRYSIVMDKNGVFHKVRPIKEKQVGMEALYQPKGRVKGSNLSVIRDVKWKIASMVVICLLFISPIYIWLTEEEAYAVINIDINPSLNIMIDDNYRVLDVKAINEDAETLLKNIELKNQTITSFTDEIIERTRMEFGTARDRPVLFAVSYFYDHHEEDLFEAKLNQHYQQKGYPVAIYEVPEELRIQAEKDQISMNRLTAESIDHSKKAEVTKQLSSEKKKSTSSLDEEEIELIQNYYNKNEEEETSINQMEQKESANNEGKNVTRTQENALVIPQSGKSNR